MSLTLGLMQSIGDAVSSLICHVDGLQASAAQQRCDFQAVLSAVEEVNAWQSDLVMLDVGGQRFHTSHDTLCTKSDSIFRSMFGGDFLSEQQEDGSTFVDRDPRLFGHVLDFMRHGCAFLLSCHPPRSPLQRELQFYGLSSARDSVPTHGILFDKRAPGMRVSHAGRRYTNCSSTRFLHGQSSVGWYRGKHTLRIRLLTACPALAIGLCTEDVISDEGKVRYNSVVTEKELLFCLEEGTVEYAGRGYTIFDQNCSLQNTVVELSADMDRGEISLSLNDHSFFMTHLKHCFKGGELPTHPVFYNLIHGAAFTVLSSTWVAKPARPGEWVFNFGTKAAET